ncbi:MAG TPA: NADH-dependent [FeFe] hydrogenase, group A6 [Clostridia bacterium]
MNTVTLTIDGKQVTVPENYTILEAANELGINIPRLCYLKGINETSACRVCVVEIEGMRTLKNSCTVKVQNNMVVRTNTDRVKNSVKRNLMLLASNHKFDCWRCPRERNCEFLHLLRKYNIENAMGENPYFTKKRYITNITDAIVLDSSKCILCGRCVSACQKLAGTSVLDFNERGYNTYVSTAQNHTLEDSGCIYCGKCIQSCPTGALREREQIDDVLDLLAKKEYYTVVQIAPSVRAALGEEFGYPIGTNVEGKLYNALYKLGFDDITDTNFAADVTIMEEGTEFIHRLEEYKKGNKNVLPMFTSCSPGWIRYIEQYYPEFLPNLSTCKSPQQMQGALIKNYYAQKINVPKEKIKVVSIMPCIAKKYEAKRPEMQVDGIADVDYVLTTRELARMIKRQDIDFRALEDIQPASPMAKYTGAGVIFGATGGVMEAALRTVRDILEKKDYSDVDFAAVRGADNGIKEVELEIAGEKLTVAVVHGAVNFKEMFERVKQNPGKYAFVEFMACTGGCVNGGGQPIVNAEVLEKIDVRKERAKAVYGIDADKKLRKSHQNPAVIELYDEFLGKPGGEKSHKMLHTHYTKKEIYSKI